MKKSTYLIVSLAFFLCWSCNTPKEATILSGGSAKSTEAYKKAENSDANEIENPENTLTLVDHLRAVSGVQVGGTGRNARVTIRGRNSINSNTEPLFVINGQPFSGGVQAASQFVPVDQIKNIKVLKNPAQLGLYGVRGANGVIEITLK